ncbi:suppressor of fused domain protein [Chitinophaga nivalis]|uniref:Suppressor of fused domain protein n=1 Tax=Chitinophaga nivalis TaxID=2991709 RepID=A0ABT3II02_9BACT|nr:suppressor of fused domain protein [Chitinophaga nivalis]MCW3466736.1 suppressor of fused domain protein [Chitinophaga nivalis]MCW3483573.1 suppressor of fused domain protein [Chitinophaga nivalis]
MYTDQLHQHYEAYFGIPGKKITWDKGPLEKLHPDFYLLVFPPNSRQSLYTYCTVGMSAGDMAYLTELVVYAPREEEGLAELLAVCASYHRNKAPLLLYHTVNLGRPWLDQSSCDHGFISYPWLDSPLAEVAVNGQTVYCYWYVPITEQERDYKVAHGHEALEQLFEDQSLPYADPARTSLTS